MMAPRDAYRLIRANFSPHVAEQIVDALAGPEFVSQATVESIERTALMLMHAARVHRAATLLPGTRVTHRDDAEKAVGVVVPLDSVAVRWPDEETLHDPRDLEIAPDPPKTEGGAA